MFSGNDFLLIAAIWLLAFLMDKVLGEPRRFHPLVAFGKAAALLERRLNITPSGSVAGARGAVAWLVLVLPPVALTVLAGRELTDLHGLLALLFNAVILYWAIAWRSMCEHVQPVKAALESGDLARAREHLGYIVSRDTAQASEEEVLGGALESTLENSSDAFLASLFWMAAAGPGAVVLHRLANTLDAMWGYRSARYARFGCWAARCDDALNFLPAQLTALSFALLGHSRAAMDCWRRQGWRWKSINAGSVMASGAAALGVMLGGAASYHGQVQSRPVLGQGRAPALADLQKAADLVMRTFWCWWGLLVLMGIGLAV